MLHVEQSDKAIPTLVREVTERHGLILQPEACDRLSSYVESLLEWNRKHNLISRSDVDNVWQRHILHSLLPVLLCTIPRNMEFLDIGTGGGLPGVPIAIARPDLTGTLVDSVRKKVEALSGIVKAVGLSNLNVVNDRVESPTFIRRFRGSFDIVFARGVAQLPELIKWSIRLMRPRQKGVSEEIQEGKIPVDPPVIIAFKGGDVRDEIRKALRGFPDISIRQYQADVEGITDGSFTDKKLIVVGMRS
jgi:16S rRNA (guanine527-N7)-methyltransferase